MQKCLVFLISLLVVLFSSSVLGSVRINEVMYDPKDSIQCPDSNCEWIELYNNGSEAIDLSKWKIDGYNFEDIIISPGEYIIIARELIDLNGGNSFEFYWGNNNGIWDTFDGNYIAVDGYFSLKNDLGDIIMLTNNYEEIADTLNYSNDWGANGNGRTLAYYDGKWYESNGINGTPGSPNEKPNAIMDYVIVDYVTDGDTIKLEDGEWVRLIGINSPEKGEYYYEESRNRLKELVEGKLITLEMDIENKDMYGRLLRYIYVDNLFINLILVQEGYAKAYLYEPNIKYKDKFANAESEAKNKGLGIWKNINSININEVIYNPLGSDNYKEFVEIYSLNLIDLTGYIISDGDSNDILKKINNISSNYILIVEDGYILNIPNNISLYSAGASIGNGLSEDDIISVYDKNNNLIDSAQIFSVDDGYSLEFYNGNFYQSLLINGTPGYENSYNEEEVKDYKKIKINELFPDPFGNDDAEMPAGEFVELYNSGNYDLNLEGLKLKDEANHEIIITNTNTKTTIIKSKSYLTVYMNGFFGLLNNNGFEKIRLYYGSELIDEVSYFNSAEDLSWSKQESGVWNLRKQTRDKKNDENEPQASSELGIEKIYLGSDEKAKFGDSFLVKIKIYKGNTTRYSIDLYIEDSNNEKISKTTTFHVDQKYVEYDFTLPIQIKPNCDNKLSDGKYNVVIEGLGEKTTKEIEISGITSNLCDTITKQKKCKECANIIVPARMESNLNASGGLITSNAIYESSDIKATRSALYIFSLILTILALHLVLKKWN